MALYYTAVAVLHQRRPLARLSDVRVVCVSARERMELAVDHRLIIQTRNDSYEFLYDFFMVY